MILYNYHTNSIFLHDTHFDGIGVSFLGNSFVLWQNCIPSLLLLFLMSIGICVVTNGAMRFGCVVPFGTTHFFILGRSNTMFKKLKKSVSILLALVMLCGVLGVAPVTVSAAVTEYTASGDAEGEYTFNTETGELHLESGSFTGNIWQYYDGGDDEHADKCIWKADKAEGLKKFNGLDVLSVTASPGVKFVGDCSNMFDGYGLNGFKNCERIDLSNVDTSSVTNMHCMFRFNSSLKFIDVSSFNTSNVTDMSYMFSGCTSLTSLDLSSFDTSNLDRSLQGSRYLGDFHMLNNCTNLREITISDQFKDGITSNICLNNGENNTNGWRISPSDYAERVSGNGFFAVIEQPAAETTYKWIQYGTVTWNNWDDSTLDTEDYKLETIIHPTYKGAITPTRPDTYGKTYTFAGWTDGENTYGLNDELPVVAGDITYTAEYTETSTLYTLNYIYQGRSGGNKGGYIGDDGDTDEKTYTVTVELGDSDLEASGMPKAKVLVDNAPVVNDPYKNCRWTFTDEYVRFDPENKVVTITANQPERKYSVIFKDSNGDTTDAFRVKLNEYVKKNDSFITVPETDGSGIKFAYWSVVQNDKEVARCFERRFNLRVTGDSVVTAQYGEAENLVTLSEAEISRQQFTENGTTKDLLYADFITAYMNKQGMELSTKSSSEYKTGMIVQYSPDVKVAKENAPGATLSASDKIEFANGDLLSKENAKTIANGGTVGGKYSYLTAPIDNAKYNDKNRLNKSLVFTNTENARRLVLCAYYYVYNVKTDEIEMTAPVYFYLYDAGNAIVEES